MKQGMFKAGLLSCTALFWTPALIAQEEGTKPESEQSGKDWDNMSEQELMQELLQSLKDACDGMGKLEGELAKASLPERKVDERFAELQALVEKLGKDGEKLDSIPEGLEQYFKDNPDKLAELLGTTGDDAKALLGKEEELVKKLGEADDKLAELLKNSDVMEKVVELQGKVEDDLTSALDAQEKLGDQTQREIEEALEAAYALRKQ